MVGIYDQLPLYHIESEYLMGMPKERHSKYDSTESEVNKLF